MGNSEPAESAYKVTRGSSVDDAALRKPIWKTSNGNDSFGQARSVVVGFRARDDNNKGTQWGGMCEYLVSCFQSAKKPMQGSCRRVGKAGSREGEMYAMDGR